MCIKKHSYSMCLKIIWWLFIWSLAPCCWTASKKWISKSSIQWKDWYNRVIIGDINFPSNLEVPLAFPTSDSAECEIIFPLDDLIPEDEELPLFSNGASCPAEAQVVPDEGSLWINPNNWLGSSPAAPHLERLPCMYDEANFPGGDDWFVVLPNKKIHIGRIKIDGNIISKYETYKILSDRFIKHFVVFGENDAASLIKMEYGYSLGCKNKTGCECGTSELYKEVCSLVSSKCPTKLNCPNPVQPRGYCCPICGVYMELTFNPDVFTYMKMDVQVTKLMKDYPDVIHYMSKISDDTLQIVLIARNNKTTNLVEVYRASLGLKNLLTLSKLYFPVFYFNTILEVVIVAVGLTVCTSNPLYRIFPWGIEVENPTGDILNTSAPPSSMRLRRHSDVVGKGLMKGGYSKKHHQYPMTAEASSPFENRNFKQREYVDFGAHTGSNGAFGWYADFPVQNN